MRDQIYDLCFWSVWASVNESEVVGVAFSVPVPPYTEEMLVAVVNERADGRAEAVDKHLQAAFQQVGVGSGDWPAWKSSRFAVAVGDQALAPGGPANEAQKLGLRVLWEGLRRPRRDVADAFHLINRAGKLALKHGPAIEAFFRLLKKLEHLFGMGHGRHVDRCVAAFLGQPQLACRSPAGHRKTGMHDSSSTAGEQSRRECDHSIHDRLGVSQHPLRPTVVGDGAGQASPTTPTDSGVASSPTDGGWGGCIPQVTSAACRNAFSNKSRISITTSSSGSGMRWTDVGHTPSHDCSNCMLKCATSLPLHWLWGW